MINVVGEITDLTLHTLLHGNIDLDFYRNCIVFEAVFPVKTFVEREVYLTVVDKCFNYS